MKGLVMQRWVCAVMTTVAVCLISNTATARTITIDIKRTDVRPFTPENTELGSYYAFDLKIPAKLPAETFMDAYLEMYVDAASAVDTASGYNLATIQVYPLKSALSGELASSQLRAASMKRTIQLGESRRVKINISEHVRHLLTTPADDFGLVVGSLTGQRLGKFTLKHGVLGAGVVARVTFIYHKLEGPASASQ